MHASKGASMPIEGSARLHHRWFESIRSELPRIKDASEGAAGIRYDVKLDCDNVRNRCALELHPDAGPERPASRAAIWLSRKAIAPATSVKPASLPRIGV